MHIAKKLLTISLSAAMILTCFSTIALADEDDGYTNDDYIVSSVSIEEAEDDDEGLVATWDQPDGNTKYKLQLYKGTTKVGDAININYNTTSYNITKKIVSKGTGTYHVTLYPMRLGKQFTVTSNYIYVTTDDGTASSKYDTYYMEDLKDAKVKSSSSSSSATANVDSGPGAVGNTNTSNNQSANSAWLKAADGSDKWWYRHGDGSYVSNNWELISNIWYYFDQDGWMKTGWFTVNGIYYCADANGALYVNTTTPDGYKVDSNGALIR